MRQLIAGFYTCGVGDTSPVGCAAPFGFEDSKAVWREPGQDSIPACADPKKIFADEAIRLSFPPIWTSTESSPCQIQKN
jgi:hypothetical protein